MKNNDKTQKVRETYARLREGIVRDAKNRLKCFGDHPKSCRDDCTAEVYYACVWAWKQKMNVTGAIAVLEETDA